LDLRRASPRKEIVRRVFIVPLAVAALIAVGGGLWVGATSGKTAAGSRLGPIYGISLDLPSGWIGQIYDGNRGSPTYAVLQATSFNGAGPGVLSLDDQAAAGVGEQMSVNDLVILLWESGGGGGEAWEPLVDAPNITRADFSPIEGFAHPVARIFFTTQGRFFDLMVEFGTASPEQLARANDLLATLRIEARS
jgi:hypothetical protein